MNRLPEAISLHHAIKLVIEQNKSIGYNPNRFINKLEGLNGMALVEGVAELIKNERAVTEVYKHLEKYKEMWTIEDFVKRYGSNWGFDSETIIQASQNIEIYNNLRR